MKNCILLFTFMLLIATIHGQSIMPEIIAATGDFYSNSVGMLSFTEGELMVETDSSPNNFITQGFQQPWKFTVGIIEIDNNSVIILYPNPLTSSSTLQLNTQLKNAEAVIYDVLGKEMMRRKMDGDRMEIERRSLESGVYFVRVRNADRQWVEKLVVE